MIELLKDENETLKQTLRILEQHQESDHVQIEKNRQKVDKLEDRFLFQDGAGI